MITFVSVFWRHMSQGRLTISQLILTEQPFPVFSPHQVAIGSEICLGQFQQRLIVTLGDKRRILLFVAKGTNVSIKESLMNFGPDLKALKNCAVRSSFVFTFWSSEMNVWDSSE